MAAGAAAPLRPRRPGWRVTATAASSVSLAWTAPAGTVTGFYVYSGGSRVASVTGTSATVTGLAAGTGYTFTVTAYNSAGESAPSGAVQAATASGGGEAGAAAASRSRRTPT